jgi:small-conductance mechanosensitive channel
MDLSYLILGIELRRWLIAIAIFVGIFLASLLARRLLVGRLRALSALTPTKTDDLIVEMLANTRGFLIFAWSLYLAEKSLGLSGETHSFFHKLALLLTTAQIAVWGNVAVKFWVEEYLRPRAVTDSASATTVGLISFLAKFLLFITIFLLALNNLGVNITALVAGLGVGGIAVALAVQNILGDLFASLTIVLDKPFVVGDYIVVGDLQGTVEQIGLKTTRIRALGGEQLIFSNADLLQSRIRNFKRMQERRVIFPIGVTYQTPESALRKIPSMIQEAIESQQHARLDRTALKGFAASSIDFETQYLLTSADAALFAQVHQEICLRIFSRFQTEGIEFAYPTQMIYSKAIQS